VLKASAKARAKWCFMIVSSGRPRVAL